MMVLCQIILVSIEFVYFFYFENTLKEIKAFYFKLYF